MNTTESIGPGEGMEPQAVNGLPPGTHLDVTQRRMAGLERFARENYNMAQPGETVLRLVPEPPRQEPSP